MIEGRGVEPIIGELLNLLVRLARPNIVLETGTFVGDSADAIARGLQANGKGKLYTCDVNPQSVSLARNRLAGMPVEVLEARGAWMLSNLRHLPDYPEEHSGLIEFAHIDSGKNAERLAELDLLGEDTVAPGGIICVHDVSVEHDLYAEFAARHDWPHLVVPSTVGMAVFQRPL